MLLMLTSFNVLHAQVSITHVFGDHPLPAPPGVVNTTEGTQQGRLFRGGVPTTCTSNYAAGILSSGSVFAFEAYTFRAATTGCLEIDVSETAASVYFAVYQGVYDPGNMTANRIAEQGSSTVGLFGGEVVGGQLYTLVVMESGTNASGTAYSVTLDNVAEPSAVPISGWGITFAAVFMLAFLVLRKRLVNA